MTVWVAGMEMTQDEYVYSILSKYRLETGPTSPAYQAANALSPTIRGWANDALLGTNLVGSYAKGTGVKGSTDADLFISLKPETNGTLRDIYESLYKYVAGRGLEARRQNVSIGVKYGGLSFDLIPAKKQPGNTQDHSLFRNKTQTWTQTNVDTHIKVVRESGRCDEIRAVKIWRNLNTLEFPSFYLELTVLEALHGKSTNNPAANVLAVLQYLTKDFEARVMDPANSNNVVSEDLTKDEKLQVANKASISLGKKSWGEIIW